jgi:hypothetical protein
MFLDIYRGIFLPVKKKAREKRRNDDHVNRDRASPCGERRSEFVSVHWLGSIHILLR